MGVADVISKTKKPLTKVDLVKGLKQLKVDQQELLVVYANLESFDYIIGGAQTVIEAIYEVAGYHTTIVMPAHELNQSCPTFFDETLPKKWMNAVRKNTPAFDVELSPIKSGVIAQTFARNTNVFRSEHPTASFIAAGRKADWFMANHRLDSMFGEKSPLQKLYAQDAKLLCLGIQYEQLTALHLAEYFAGCREKMTYEAVVLQQGKRTLVEFEDLALNSKAFAKIGEAYEQSIDVLKCSIEEATCSLIDYRSLVDFAAQQLNK